MWCSAGQLGSGDGLLAGSGGRDRRVAGGTGAGRPALHERWRARDEQPGQAERCQADRQRPADEVAWRREGGHPATPAGRAQAGCVGRGQLVVARPRRRGHRLRRRSQGDEVGEGGSTQPAAVDQRLGSGSLRAGRRIVGQGGEEHRVVGGVGGGGSRIGHVPRQTGGRGMRFPRRRPEPGRVGRSQPEVARPRRDGLRAHGDRQGEQVIAKRGAVGAARNERVGRQPRPRARGRRPGSTRSARDRGRRGSFPVPCRQPRNSSIRSSSRARSASRPRWMRDLTVPSDTPVISAISA